MGSDFVGMTGERYSILYKRFMQKPVDEMLLIHGSVEGMRVLDLCAGGCRLGQRALELGAETVVAVDASAEMMGSVEDPADKMRFVVCDLREGLMSVGADLFDVAFCQQGVNYWWNRATVAHVANSLCEDGAFIFNTFNRKPSEEPRFRKVSIDGVWYSEVDQLISGDRVFHVQMCGDDKPHVSVFHWVEPDRFYDVLSSYFRRIDVICDGASSTYVAVGPKKG